MRLAISLAIVACAACGGQVAAERRMELGFVEDGAFRLLEAEETLWVREAPQTGKWVMPSVRVWGVKGVATVKSRITLDDGRVAGAFRANLPFVTEDETTDAMRFDMMPIPIGIEPGGPAPQEVYGERGVLEVEIDDGQHGAVSATNRVRLENGDDVSGNGT